MDTINVQTVNVLLMIVAKESAKWGQRTEEETLTPNNHINYF